MAGSLITSAPPVMITRPPLLPGQCQAAHSVPPLTKRTFSHSADISIGERLRDPLFPQLDDRLDEQVVGSVEVVEQHLVGGPGRSRGTAQREVHESVDREVLGDAVEQFLASGLAARRARRSPVARSFR
ncbi:hypothetical protein ACQFX6_03700 [Streptomyces sp. DSM 41987]|uniref:hypothetical protein n=1 Tax=Streptomyces TaxID=1883 RepID=UPI0018DF11BB|nr:hypothetical protein [Streptomyces fildesensis]